MYKYANNMSDPKKGHLRPFKHLPTWSFEVQKKNVIKNSYCAQSYVCVISIRIIKIKLTFIK